MSSYGSFNQEDSSSASERAESTASDIERPAVVNIDSDQNRTEARLVFSNVHISIDNCQILKNVSGMASSGEIFAILGPSGAGKSTLLNALAGRRQIASGKITLDGQEVNRNLRRKVSYVLQDDVFYPRLTLRETLTFTAMLKLPESTTKEQRDKRIQEVIDLLELNKCIDTKMGSPFETGLSGGEKKRASIACELINNPKILILDEPTSGLDSAIASSLMRALTNYARKSYKTVVTTIHQPSSQMFRMFNNVMFLTEGEVAYYGSSNNVIEYFGRLGFHCDSLYNPADFVLEQLKGDAGTVQRILDYAEAERIKINREAKSLQEDAVKSDKRLKPALEMKKQWWKFNSNLHSKDAEKVPLLTADVNVVHAAKEPKWPTGFISQYVTLTRRCFVLSRSRFLSLMNLCQILFVSIFVGLLWFQLPRTEDTGRDKLGLIFFLSLQQGFFFSHSAIPLIFDDSGVFMKERAAGMYRLSAFLLAIMTAEIPITIVLASTFVTIAYWMVGLMPHAVNYFGYLGVLLLNAFQAQSFGFCMGTLFRDRTKATTLTVTFMVVFFLPGGFYITHISEWLMWVRYTSFITYVFSALSDIEFTYGLPLSCSPPTKTTFPEYCTNGTILPGEAFVKQMNIDVCPLYVSIIVLFCITISLRFVVYYVLRFFRRPDF